MTKVDKVDNFETVFFLQKSITAIYEEMEEKYKPKNLFYKYFTKKMTEIASPNLSQRESVWINRYFMLCVPASVAYFLFPIYNINPLIFAIAMLALIVSSITYASYPLRKLIKNTNLVELQKQLLFNLKKLNDNLLEKNNNTALLFYNILLLKERFKFSYKVRINKEYESVEEIINEIIEKLGILNKKEKKEYSILKNNSIKLHSNRFKNFRENELQLYMNEEDIISAFTQNSVNLVFLIEKVNLELPLIQKYIPLISLTAESLQYLIDYCNTDYYKNDIELFFSFVKKEQVKDNCFKLIEQLIGFEKTQKIMNEGNNREKHIAIENIVNTEIFKTLKMNGRNYE